MSSTDELRLLAFDALYQLHTGAERGDRAISAADATIAALTPEQRTRVHQMALRRLAFQLLFEIDVSGTSNPDELITRALTGTDDLGPIAAAEVTELVKGTFRERAAADAEFLKLAPEWPTHRLAAVDRAILRLAHFEMTSARSHPKIVINESVELAKHFSTDRSPAFINGLLDKVLKRLAPAPGVDSGDHDSATKPTS